MDYIYFNVNPSGETLPDCVTRAISLALNIPYYEVVSLLRNNGIFYECECLCVSCYERLLDDYFKLPHFKTDKSVEEIIKEHPEDTLLIRMNSHLTCAINGKSYDIFNCTDEIATDYWVIT